MKLSVLSLLLLAGMAIVLEVHAGPKSDWTVSENKDMDSSTEIVSTILCTLENCRGSDNSLRHAAWKCAEGFDCAGFCNTEGQPVTKCLKKNSSTHEGTGE